MIQVKTSSAHDNRIREEIIMKGKWLGLIFCLICLLVMLTVATPAQSKAPDKPGSRPPGTSPVTGKEVDSIMPFIVETGRVSVSIDALGTLNTTGEIQVMKPAGATVRKAFLASATTGFAYYNQGPLADGDVYLEYFPVYWNTITESSIYSYNHLADVTVIIKAVVDPAPAGRVDLNVFESDSYRIDGETLVVIFDDPSQSEDNTVALLFGAQNWSGDTFEITFDRPIDTDDPNLVLDMSLAISYGAQGCANGQYSQIDVNGSRLTTSAGGEDDGTCANGALVTAGGVDDSNANPPDPYSGDTDDPRYDDELYNLKPFVEDGDTGITVNTYNPSADDNIFMAVFSLSGSASIGIEPARPVFFLPGIGGSRLNDGDEEIWPNAQRLLDEGDEHLDALVLTEEGLDPEGSNITVGKIITEEVFTIKGIVIRQDVYKSTFERLEELGYEENVDLFPFPYDFRKDITTTVALLESAIKAKTGDTIGGVDLIGHSQGGLVTKACVLTPSCAKLVNSAAILGSPFAGVLKGPKILEYGESFPNTWWGEIWGVSAERFKSVTQNWPVVYELIPGPNYYQLWGQGYFVYDRDLDGDGDHEGRLNYPAMKDFISDRHNDYLVQLGENFQQNFGEANWQNGTNDVNVVVFAGSGLPTLTEIREHEWGFGWVDVDFTESDTGDTTVNAISAALKNDSGVDFTGGNVNVFYRDQVNHGNLPKDRSLLQYVTTIFLTTPQRETLAATQAEASLPPPPEGISTEPTYVNGRQYQFSGDLDVEVVDQSGNRTGRGEGNAIELSAEGATFTVISNTISIFLYGSGPYTMTIEAREEGLGDIKLRSVEESVFTRQVSFMGAPFEGEDSTAVLRYDPGNPQDILEMDQDGNGTFEETVLPNGDASADDLTDAIPPVTAITVEGSQQNGLYLGCVKVILTAQDNAGGSGVANIVYTLNDSTDPFSYTGPITLCVPGITQVHAIAVDQNGNRERTPVTKAIKIAYAMYMSLVVH
jgi:pimeloyl-ACP methyl ester carboxylesterase